MDQNGDLSAEDSQTGEVFEAAGRLARAGRWDEALALYERAALETPDIAGLHQALGDARARAGQAVPAAQSYLAALEREPLNTILLDKLADLQRRSGDPAGADATQAQARALRAAGIRRDFDTPLPLVGSEDLPSIYLDLVRKCLTYLLWDGADGSALELHPLRPVVSLARLFHKLTGRAREPSIEARRQGQDWPARALTMVGEARLENIQACVERAMRDGVPGDLIEAGVWRGGAAIFMRAILKAYGEPNRTVWAADSFQGLPRPDLDRHPADRGYDLSVWRTLAVDLEEVRGNFARFGLLDDQVRFLPGWFAESLPSAPIERLAVMRLDGDLYGSTMDALTALYPKLSPGGFVILDDYYNSPPCGQAVNDFRAREGVDAPLVKVDWSAAYWRKP